MFPSAVVTGVDLAPIQPTLTTLNMKVEVDDLEKVSSLIMMMMVKFPQQSPAYLEKD